jgi:hypothetical protein
MSSLARRLSVLSLAALALLLPDFAQASGSDAFVPAGTIGGDGRVYQSAVRLLDGRVLVVGGYGRADGGALDTAEVFDPGTGTWTPTDPLGTPRVLLTASLLPDGRVLVTGGSHHAAAHASTEIWDPATGTWSAAAPMSVARFAHSAARLLDGRILVTGGNASTASPVATTAAEIYDPVTGSWSATGSLLHPRQTHASVLLADGRVLVVGGDAGSPGLYKGTTTCQVWSPVTGVFSAAASMTAPRGQHAAVRLLDGRVLTVGGNSNATGFPITSAEVYDPAIDLWESAGTTASGGTFPALAALSDGRALALGGQPTGSSPSAAADVFDPATGAFAPTVSMAHPRMGPSATTLADGSVLVVGGYANFTTFPHWNTACERFVPGVPDLPPTADAGPDQALHAGELVTLDGSASHDDDTPTSSLTFAWTLTVRPAGSVAILAGAATASPSFTADVTGIYVASLVVTDEALQSSSADEVVVSSENLAPAANAGPDMATEVDAPVMLLGTASDPDDDALDVSWTIVSAPLGSAPALADGDTLTPTLTADLEGEYVLALVVDDGFDESPADTVTVTVTPPPVDVEAVLDEALDAVIALPRAAFDSAGHRVALSVQIRNVLADLRDGAPLAEILAALQRLVERTDGFALRGAADARGAGKDWVVTAAAQGELYPLLVLALETLTP